VRFPAEVIQAVRAIMPAGMPLSVRISASDWAQGGLSDDDLIATARALHEAGADVLDVSTGQTVPWQKPVYGRMYQTPFSDFIRNTLNVPTIAVGNIYEPDHVNSIVASGRADLCAVARPHLANPSWTLQAAAQLQHAEQHWPPQYLSGKSQLERNLQRAALLAGAV
jgi:anthraniloyl-CoA monooxygenase